MNPRKFELLLLSRMIDEYRSAMLSRYGLSRQCITQLIERPVFSSGLSIDDHERAMDCSAENSVSIRSSSGGDHVRHNYVLDLWPRFYWSLFAVDGLVYKGSFTPREKLVLLPGALEQIQPGEVCLEDLAEMGATWELVDGWDEPLTLRIRSSEQELDGIFVFQLFQTWMKDESRDTLHLLGSS